MASGPDHGDVPPPPQPWLLGRRVRLRPAVGTESPPSLLETAKPSRSFVEWVSEGLSSRPSQGPRHDCLRRGGGSRSQRGHVADQACSGFESARSGGTLLLQTLYWSSSAVLSCAGGLEHSRLAPMPLQPLQAVPHVAQRKARVLQCPQVLSFFTLPALPVLPHCDFLWPSLLAGLPAHQTGPCLRTFALAAPPALSTAGSLMDLNSPDVTFSVQPSLPRAPLCPACAAPSPLLFSGMPCFLTCSASRLCVHLDVSSAGRDPGPSRAPLDPSCIPEP